MSILDKEIPADGPTIKFEKPGDSIVGQFLERRTGVKTKLGDDGVVTSLFVVNTNIAGVDKGINASMFEGTHVRQLMGDAGLNRGDGFVLRFAETKGRFKKFAFLKLRGEDLQAEALEAGVELPEAVF